MKSAITLALTLSLAGQAFAAESPTKAELKAAPAPAGTEQMRAYVDPETGALSSQPPAGARAIEMERQMDLIREINHPNGMTEWVFNGQADEAMTAQVDGAGKVSTYCEAHGIEHAHSTDSKESNDE